MAEKFNPNSFAPFLEAVKNVSGAASAPLDILRMPVPAAAALREFEAAGLLATLTEDGRQIVMLTPLGEQVARGQP